MAACLVPLRGCLRMISDASKWVSIDIDSWHYIEGSGVEPVAGGYKLNGASISTEIELTGRQISEQYGVIFTITDFHEMKSNYNYCQLTFYDEQGHLLDAGLSYLPISEECRIWTEVEAPGKTYKVELNFHGDFTVTLMQIYAVNSSVSIDPATPTVIGTVRPIAKGGLTVIVKDNEEKNEKVGDLSINCGDGITITEEGKLSTTSDLSGSNWKSLFRFTNGFIVNGALKENGEVDPSVGYFFERKTNGDLIYKNGDRTIPITSYDRTMPQYKPHKKEEGGEDAV